MPSPFRRSLAHPVPLVAAVILVLNDHWWKASGSFPTWLTGKLSDFAGLFLAPIVVVAVLRAVAPRVHRVEAAASLLTAVVFALLKVAAPVCAIYNRWVGPAVLDTTDLLALPSCALAWLWMTHARLRPPFAAKRTLERGAFVLSALACVATSRPPPDVRSPSPAALASPCAEVTLVGDVLAPVERVVLRARRRATAATAATASKASKASTASACHVNVVTRVFVQSTEARVAYEGGGSMEVDVTDALRDVEIPMRLPFATACSTPRRIAWEVEERRDGTLVGHASAAEDRRACLSSVGVAAP